jgi:hypothetical protein
LVFLAVAFFATMTFAQSQETSENQPSIQKMCDYVFSQLPERTWVFITLNGKEYKAFRISWKKGDGDAKGGEETILFYEISRTKVDPQDHVSCGRDNPNENWENQSGKEADLKAFYYALSRHK